MGSVVGESERVAHDVDALTGGDRNRTSFSPCHGGLVSQTYLAFPRDTVKALMTPLNTHDNWHWRDVGVTPGPAVIFDIDGVLADRGRSTAFS